jgi:nitroreductase
MTGTTDAAALRSWLQAAVLAPSSHNTQPWLFEIRGRRVHLLADRTRALPANDPADRELTISCGCALMNLRVAAAADNRSLLVATLPIPGDDDILAEVDLAPSGGELEAIGQLAAEIPRRRTYRKRFEHRPVPEAVTRALCEAAAAEGATLNVLGDPVDIDTVVTLVAEGDSQQWADPSWRRELAQWMHPRRERDGLAMPGLVATIAQMVVRTFDMGNGVAARDRQLAEGSPVIAVLSTPHDDPGSWLIAGQALQRCLLSACAFGLQASYMNQPIEIPALRPRLQALLPGRPMPQILLRLGYPSEQLDATPRRELADVVKTLD